MTTQNEARGLIYTRMKDGWVDGSDPLTPLTFDNEDFTPPSDEAWVRLSVRHTPGNSAGPSGQYSLGGVGNRKFQRTGRVFLQIFTLKSEGTKDADTLLTAFRNLFEAVSFDGLDFNSVTAQEIGNDGQWWQMNAVAEFSYMETK